MDTFVVESYLSRDAAGEPDRTIERAIATVAEMERSGHAIRYLRAIYVPGDEICLHVFEAESLETVGVAVERAGLDPDRIVIADSRELATRG